jgi:hypothetical protein
MFGGYKMPNWCNNTITISHDDMAMMKRVVKGYNQNKLLDEFIPIPLELKEGAMNSSELMKIRNWEYKKELDKVREELNRKYFGYKDWYDYCVSEWGTKWDVGRDTAPTLLMKDIKDKTVTFDFDSAWSFPSGAYEKLVDMGFSIKAYYFEGGMGFCGMWENGSDDYYEIHGNSEWVLNNIPASINQHFGISENMAEWEAENAEENQDA